MPTKSEARFGISVKFGIYKVNVNFCVSAGYLPYIWGVNSGYIYRGVKQRTHFFSPKKTLIYPVFDVESIGEVPRGPGAHLHIHLGVLY